MKLDTKAKKKADTKQETDTTTANEEVKQHVYQWKSITADGQVFIQNSTNQEYEKIDQLRLILETNPKTNEVLLRKEKCRNNWFTLIFSKWFIVKIKLLLSFVPMDLVLLVLLMEQGKIEYNYLRLYYDVKL